MMKPLTALNRQLRIAAQWVARCQSDSEDAYGFVPQAEAEKHRARAKAELDTLRRLMEEVEL